MKTIGIVEVAGFGSKDRRFASSRYENRYTTACHAWVDSMCTPQPLGTYTKKLVLTGAREGIAKKTYIRAKGYAQPIFDTAEEKLKKDPTWRVLPVQSGHDVMIDTPDRLVEMLLEAA